MSGCLWNRHDTSATFLLKAIVDKWKFNQAGYESPSQLIRTSLSKAGVSSLGPEALQIHMILFRNIFLVEGLPEWLGTAISNKKWPSLKNQSWLFGLHSNSSELMRASNNGHSPGNVNELGFSASDYFKIVQDEKLGWMLFLSKVLPWLRLEVANNFLEKCQQFIRSTKNTSDNLSDIQLLLASISLVHSIIINFLPVDPNAEIERQDNVLDSLLSEVSLKPDPFVSSDTQNNPLVQLSRNLTVTLESLLQLCRSKETLESILQDIRLFNQLIESLTLSIAILNPFTTIQDTAKLLLNSHIGQVVTPNLYKKDYLDRNSKKNMQSSKEWGAKGQDDNFIWTEVALEKEKSGKENPEQSLTIDKVKKVSVSDMKFRTFSNLMNIILSKTPATLLGDLICWFSKGDVKNNKEFYKSFVDITFTSRDIHAGLHVLSGKALYSWLVKFLQNLATGSLQPNKAVENYLELQDVISKCSLPNELCDFSGFQMTLMEDVLMSKLAFKGQDDLDLIKMAVKCQKSGWKDLLEAGLTNTDVHGWWQLGFLDLVRENLKTLSTARNVRLVLNILCQSRRECLGNKFLDDINELFGVMFRHLPTLLQEQVVLSTLSPSGVKDRDINSLQGLLSEGEIVKQITPLLNRLTSVGVNKMMSQILILCLYDTDAVMQQTIHVAIQNKAQVLPVVTVLHRMPCICCHIGANSSQPKLLLCLHKVLSGITINGNKADNIVQLLCSLTEKYNQEVDVDHKIVATKELPGLLSHADVLQNFICPSFSSDVANEISAKQAQDCTNNQSEAEAQNQQELCGQTTSSSLVKSKPADIAEIDSGHTKDCMTSEPVSVIPLDVSLQILAALLDKVDELNILSLKPFPLLIVLTEMYARSYCVFVDGELDKRRLLIKQSSQNCIALLTAAVWKYFKMFTKEDFLWLKKKALKTGWLYTVMLKPVLNMGCDVELHDVLGSFVTQLMTEGKIENNTRGLVLLLQLSLVNNEMLSDVCSVLKLSKLSLSHSQLVFVLGYILTLSLTSEMYRLVDIIIMLLTNQDEPFPVDSNLFITDLDRDVLLRIHASQVLTDAVLQLSLSELNEDSWCHIVSNYQAALHSLLLVDTHKFWVLVSLFCHCCIVLTAMEGQPVQLLQVLAMDILTKLKACLPLAAEGGSDVAETEKDEKYKKGISVVENYIYCISEKGLRKTFLSQVSNFQ